MDGGSGLGEGTIPPYYGINAASMAAFWRIAALKDEPFPDDPAEIPAWVGAAGPAPARAALDMALHDRIARRMALPLYTLLGLPRPAPFRTSFTISLDRPHEMAELAALLFQFFIFKVKLGSPADLERLQAVRRARPDAGLRVDANAAWSRAEAAAFLKPLEEMGIETLEQPLAKEDIEGLGLLQKSTRIPVVADESLQAIEDIDRLAKAGVAAVNIKLMKAGGLAPGLAMVQRARRCGLRLMLGCMIETSLGITAAAHLAGLADWVDLDAPLLVSNDPFEGLHYDGFAAGSLRNAAGSVPFIRKGTGNEGKNQNRAGQSRTALFR